MKQSAVTDSSLRNLVSLLLFVRYPYNLEFDYGALDGLNKYSINNLGDPFIESNYVSFADWDVLEPAGSYLRIRAKVVQVWSKSQEPMMVLHRSAVYANCPS